MSAALRVLRQTAIGTIVTVAVILFYFTVVGVFGLTLAILSLIFGVAFAVAVMIRTNQREPSVER